MFTFHHNQPDAYQAVAMAILDAGLISTASLPCPAEMAASIHSSSIVDTVFVCRELGTMRGAWRFENADDLARLMTREMDELCAADMKPTIGDMRCIAFGHITRRAIWGLRSGWDPSLPTAIKLTTIRSAMDAISTVGGALEALYLEKKPIMIKLLVESSAVRYFLLDGSEPASLDAQTAWPPADQSQPSCQARMKDRDQDNRPSGLRRSR